MHPAVDMIQIRLCSVTNDALRVPFEVCVPYTVGSTIMYNWLAGGGAGFFFSFFPYSASLVSP